MRYRAFLSAVVLFAGFSAFAQAEGTRSFEATDALDRTALKFVIQAVTDLDPMAKVLHSDDMRILQVQSIHISDAELRTAIEGTGLQLREGTPDLSTYLPAPDPNAPPIYVVTGDETQDLERYRTAVSTWNTAHPDQPYATSPIHTNDR